MFRFTIRDVLWLTVVGAILVACWTRGRTEREVFELSEANRELTQVVKQLRQCVEIAEWKARHYDWMQKYPVWYTPTPTSPESERLAQENAKARSAELGAPQPQPEGY